MRDFVTRIGGICLNASRSTAQALAGAAMMSATVVCACRCFGAGDVVGLINALFAVGVVGSVPPKLLWSLVWAAVVHVVAMGASQGSLRAFESSLAPAMCFFFGFVFLFLPMVLVDPLPTR